MNCISEVCEWQLRIFSPIYMGKKFRLSVWPRLTGARKFSTETETL